MSTTSLPHRIFRDRLDLIVVFVLLAAGLAIYAQTLADPFVSFDDVDYVVGNPHVRHGLTWEDWRWAWTSFERSNWHPITWLSLMLDAQLYGLNAGGYHLTNVLLHLASGVLLFRWLRIATGARWPSAWTALFFIVHPMHVESVAWVTERKDVLSTFFFCLMLLAYTRYARSGGWGNYALSLGWFALGLAAKPMLVTAPFLLVLLDFWPLRRVDGWRRRAVEKLPFLVLVAASCVVTLLAQRAIAIVPLEYLPVTHRLGAAVLGYGFYIVKTFWPVDLAVYYPYSHTTPAWEAWAWGVALLAVTAGSFRVARRMPWLCVGWCWFVGALVPVIGVVQVGGQAAADRYTYLPHIGLFIAVFWTAARWAGRGLVGLAAAGAAACLALSVRQAGYWRSSVALFEHTLAVVRPTGHLYDLLGEALIEDGRTDAAERVFRQAWNAGSRGAETVAPWTGVLLKQGRWADAMALLRPLADDPQASESVFNNLGFALVKLSRPDEALTVYERCVHRYPDYALAHFGLGELYQSRGDNMNAMGEYEAGLAAQDDWVPALTRLAWLYALSGNGELQARALVMARHAVNVSGGADLASLDALAAAAAAMGRWEEAVRAALAAVDLASRPGAPTGAEALCQARLERYRQKLAPLP